MVGPSDPPRPAQWGEGLLFYEDVLEICALRPPRPAQWGEGRGEGSSFSSAGRTRRITDMNHVLF